MKTDSALKDRINKHIKALNQFNKWEASHPVDMEDRQKLALVFELYDLISENARQRDVNVDGIIRMRKALSCLK